jgi:hypothetical protein
MAAVAGVRAATATLTADTADTVTLSGGSKLSGEIVNHGDGTVWYRTDGTTAVAEADECYPVLANERLSIRLPESGEVSIIGGSGETPTYTVLVTS